MVASREQWWEELDELKIELRLAEASLREAEAQGRRDQAIRSQDQIESLMREISVQRARPFAT